MALQNDIQQAGETVEMAGDRHILVEFVSANPNGPITVSHGRGGAIGDTLAAILEWTGNTVSREFYVNDAVGSQQMQVFAQSLFARYRQLLGQPDDISEDGYPGEYVIEIARQIVESEGDRYVFLTPEAAAPIFQNFALHGMREQQAATLAAFGIHYDNWFSEQTLHASGAVEKVLDTLKERGFAFEEKGALWLRSTQFGDDNDRVLIRAEGSATYLAGDLAYHADKLERGFALLVDVWGADHQGYVARTKAGLAALGYAPEQLQIALYQPVHLIRNGVEETVGKQTGNSVTLDELIREVGKDAARFFFLLQSSDASEDFDLDLARRQSRENPVYNVQSAHVRCCSALKKAQESGIVLPGSDAPFLDFSHLTQSEEVALVEKLADFPAEVAQAAQTLAPQRIARYVLDVASLVHTWCDNSYQNPDLILAVAARTTLANALDLMGVSAPERMPTSETTTATVVA